MAETSDPVKWNQELEKVFIEILLEEAQADQEKIRNGILTKEHAQAVTLLFYGRTGKDYNAEHISGRSDKEWDSNTNRVRGSKDAWAEAVAVSIIHLINFHAVHSLNFSCKQSNIYHCL